MTREEAIEKIEKYQCKRVGMVSERELEEALNMAIEALEQEPKPSEVARDIATIIENEQDMRVIAHNYESKWIPCSERLPEENGKYVVTENIYRVDDKEHEDSYYSRIEFAEFAYGEWQRANFIEVVAWIDLKPYEESDEQ